MDDVATGQHERTPACTSVMTKVRRASAQVYSPSLPASFGSRSKHCRFPGSNIKKKNMAEATELPTCSFQKLATIPITIISF